jgi:dynein light intermediate chain 1, cytosolic
MALLTHCFSDILARLSLYLLTDPSPSFTPLLKPLMNPRTLPNMMIVVLLDWNHPWAWLRQLREWIHVLRALLISLDDESKDVMEENIEVMRNRGRGGGEANGDNVSIPLGPGEWDEPLGIPLCIVCQNADKIEQLEKERGWKEEEFDFILQYMRTVLLKHGGSLIYTMPSDGAALQTLIHSTLGIHSMLKREQLKHNVIDRDHILVPSNWDSWGKIRIMREGFDVEGLSESWSVEIQGPMQTQQNGDSEANTNGQEEATAVSIYEDTIRDPEKDSLLRRGPYANKTNGIEVESTNNQEFLSGQLEQLEKMRAEDEKDKSSRESKKPATLMSHGDSGAGMGSGVVEEHIGPVQFNMGGIQVDADDMLKRLKVCFTLQIQPIRR